MKRVIIMLITAIIVLQFSCKKEKDDNSIPRVVFDSSANDMFFTKVYDEIYDTALASSYNESNRYKVNLMCENIDASIMPIVYVTNNYGDYVYKIDTFDNEEIFEIYDKFMGEGGTAVFDLLQIIDTSSDYDLWNLDLTFDYINKWGRSSKFQSSTAEGGFVHLFVYKNTAPGFYDEGIEVEDISTSSSNYAIKVNVIQCYDREEKWGGGIDYYYYYLMQGGDTILYNTVYDTTYTFNVQSPDAYEVGVVALDFDLKSQPKTKWITVNPL